MAAVALLFALVVFDAAFSGFRAAAGRSARIDKRAHYARAMLVGAALGVAIAVAAAGAAIALGAHAPITTALHVDHVVRRIVAFFAPFALVASALLVVRAVGSVDARSAASVLVFGPLTLLRPAVISCGCAFAIADGTRTDVALLACAAAAALLLVGPVARRLTGARARG